MVCVGIDVSKDRLDVHVLPEAIAFAVARDGKGLAELIERLRPLGPHVVAVEATGGFETVVAGKCQESCVRGRLTIMPGRTCLRT